MSDVATNFFVSSPIWRCPRCRGLLAGDAAGGLQCQLCVARYEAVAGIPDLRVQTAAWIDYEEDLAEARRLAEETEGWSVEDLVRSVFAARREWDVARTDRRTREVLAAPHRLRREISGWLSEATAGEGFLDVGCGPGMLLAAAAAEGRRGVGIDVSMVWLIVAQRLITAWGGVPILAGASAEALPLADGAVSGAVSLDVIEHVGDPRGFLAEIDRVVAPGGRIALSTPNRYSLGAEPHVSVWGVAWLPRSFQQGYVKWRSGKSYEFTRLLSAREARRLMRRHTDFRFEFLIPPIDKDDIARFTVRRAVLAQLYNQLITLKWLRSLLLHVGPFFRVVGCKQTHVART